MKKNIFKDFETRPPKLIVLLGTASFILCEDLDRQWPDIPIILCGERDYAGNKDMVLKKTTADSGRAYALDRLAG